MAKNGYKAMDSDLHVYEPHDLYLRYMDPKWGDRIPRAEPRKEHGRLVFRYADRTVVRPIELPGSRPVERPITREYKKPVERNFDPASHIEAMDMEGLDVAVLFRSHPLHCVDSFEPEYANDLCRAWNNWIADYCKADPKRLQASALITLHDAKLAAAEARRAVTELGAVCLCLVPEPVNGRHIHDFYYDPLWVEAERLGVPICFHPTVNPLQEQVARRFIAHPNAEPLYYLFRNPTELMLAAGAFCVGGVLERFPKLRVAFLEGNCSWLPWLLYRLDEGWEVKKEAADVPLRLKPSEYFRRQCFVSVDVDEVLVADVIKRVGDDNIVISTDYPHGDSHWPNAIGTFLQLDQVSEQSKRKILWDNCARLYNLN